MEPAGLLALPLEVLHHIGKFLPVEDILACSVTCHYLRDVFNHNTVWKKHLPDKFTPDLPSEGFCLEPAFCLDETLTPLCENRVTLMKKANLLNNWKNAKFVNHFTKTSYWYASGVFNVSKVVGQAIYKERYLFLGRFTNDVESDAIEVWDINKEPTLLMVLKMNELYYKHFYIVGECLVVVECIQVKVYEIRISEKALPLLFSFLITENDVVFREPSNHPWRHDYRCVGWRYSMVDHYLFANKCDDEPYSCGFHIWDIVNACKVGSFFPPFSGFAINYHSHTGSKWLLRMIKQSGDDSYFFQFDVERKSLSEHFFLVNKHMAHSMVYNSCLIFFEHSEINPEGWCDTICSVHDLNTSQQLKERRFNDAKRNHQIKSTKVIYGQFVMLCVDGFHVIDALTLETLQQFPCEGVRFITHQLNIHGSVFILAANSRNAFEVWDLSKKEKITKDVNEVYVSHLYLNESCTKLACVYHYEISVYHFL